MTRTLDVWWDQRHIGQLIQDEHGDLGFTYAATWLAQVDAPALSASLPKRAEPFDKRACRPFFGGLLPEEAQRDGAARALGVSRVNDFALLNRLGGDVAGALQILPPGHAPETLVTALPTPTPLNDNQLIGILDALPTRPLLAGQEGLRLSLAGAQSKVPVVLIDGVIALPCPGQATTHILKPPIARFAATTENEAFAMRLAAHIGLEVAAVEPRVVRNRLFLLVERYDRWRDDKGAVHRLHQEDFCQALGIPPELKYASEGGPTLSDCFALLRRVAVRPAVDVLKLLDAVIFNVMIGNADAHGKNFSLLYAPGGAQLAPLYDLMTTVAYPELSSNFAMSIGKRRRLEDLDPKGWAEFATSAGLGLPLIRRRIGEMARLCVEKADTSAEELMAPGLDADALKRYAALVRERAEFCARSSGQTGR